MKRLITFAAAVVLAATASAENAPGSPNTLVAEFTFKNSGDSPRGT